MDDTFRGTSKRATAATALSAFLDFLSSAWGFRLQCLLVCAAAGVVSIMLGPDNYWDLRYYHLYDPWAYLHGRYLYDLGPAQEQGFLNPVADFLLYGLVSSPLNDFPRLVAFIMGAVHGVNAALVFAIACHVIRVPQETERWTLRAVAFLIGVTGAGWISLLGGSSDDLTSALFVLASFWVLLKLADDPDDARLWRRFALAGLWIGLGIGLKYTSAIYAPGVGAVLALVALRRRTFTGLIAFGLVAAVGFFAVAGHHMLTLWNDFRNPFFPYLNQIFRSPWFEPTAIRDDRFIPANLWDLLAFPFYWVKVHTYVVVEKPFRDWRAAAAYVALIVAVMAYAARRLRGLAGDAPRTCDLRLVLVFVVVSYFAWALGFAYYRYAIPLEMLTGIIIVGALVWLLDASRLRLPIAVTVLTIITASTVPIDWGRRGYDGHYVAVEVPPIPPDAVVFIATWDPVAYFIPYAEPRAQYVGIENNYLELSQNNILANEVKAAMRAPGRPKIVLNVNELDRAKWNNLLAQFGLELAGKPCAPIHSNLEDQKLSLCETVERPASP
jgi:hypothetical protein